MAADARIVALFNLPVVSPPLCDAGSCVYLVDYLSKFHEHVAESASRHPWISKPEIDALGSSLHTLKATASHEKIDWMPEYGCALLKSRAGCTSGVIALNLISLDLHRFQTTSKQVSDNYSYIDSAVAKDYEIQHVGTCGLAEFQAIQGKFHSLLASAQTQTGNNRTARGSKQGHQRTPAFIHALYREAFGSPNQVSRGGMTDVGLHTGDFQKRDTAPPLVFYSLCQALHDHEAVCGIPFSPDDLFNKTIIYLGLYASQVMLQQCKAQEPSEMSTNAPHSLLEFAFSILRSTSIKAATFSDDGLDLSFFVDWSKSLRGRILKEASSQSALYFQRYELPQSDADIRGKYENYSFDLPARYSPSKESTLSEAEIRKNTHRNLGWIAVPDGRSLGDVLKWVKKVMPTTSQDVLSSMLLLRTVETHMWCYDTENLLMMGQTELETLASVVDNYREVLHNLKVSGKYLPLSLVELKSREFLVVWVAFCIIHSNAERLHETEMEGYGVPLDYNDLSHLVLSRPDEWKVALRVAKYLGKYGTNRPIFSLKDEQSTFDFGRRIANASSEMVKIWEQEVEDASCRVEGHWKEVLRKQELARKLRQEIALLQVELADANRKLIPKKSELAEHERKRWKRRSRYSTYDRYAHDICERAVNNLAHTVNLLESQLSSKNSSLESALRAPTPVFQPLPHERSNAMPLIFFLYMPPVFKLLSRFSFTSQQLRLPQPLAAAWGGNEGSQRFDLTSQVTRGSEACQLSWKDYYNSHQCSQYHYLSCPRHGSDSHLLLRSVSNAVPQEVGPKSVDHIHSRTDGIWYPDQLKPRMAWFGAANSFDRASSGREINPFATLDHFYLVANFTERLNGRDSTLQWALMQPGEMHILDTRGNLPYARQNSKPEWLSKTQYLSYTNMRSYPNNQLSNILVAIQERQLPLTDGPVHTLINQTLFHIGEISDIDTCPKLEWKRDLDDHAFGNDAYEIFESLYEEIKDSPKNYMCVKLIGKLLNCFSSWEPKCRDTARKLSMSVCQWADNLGGDIEKSPPSLHPIVRAKQLVLYQHAIITLAGGKLACIDASLLIALIVKCRNYFTGDNRSGEIQANATDIKYELCKKLDDILQCARQSPTMMTDALRSVFQRCPSSLKWKPWTPDDNDPTQCFQAKGADGHYYAINLITGEVLVDGLPPSRLPLSILDNPLYKRTFGNRNFEVVGKGEFLETCHPIFERFYRFSKGSTLRIYEFKSDESEMLELLDGTADGTVWAKDLPKRLKIMHSHWLFRGRSLIVLRDISFKDRSISFLVKLKSDAGRNIEGQVNCIELHSKKRDELFDLMQELDAMDKLVLHQSPAIDIISKFEPSQYIHSLVSPPNSDGQETLRFFLPRYKLTLELRQNVLHCREIAGYHLVPLQQTDGTLRGISMYLLLEQTCRKGRVIIFPKGSVVREPQGQVRIEVPEDCDKQLLWYQYEFHHRFDYIESKQSRASRMQLAALHIATTTVLPDELLGMTGEERAITLIRQSWGNRPLAKEECCVLDSMKKLAHGLSPTLSILCQDIEISSEQLIFLHTSNSSHNHAKTQCFEGTAYLNNVKNDNISGRCYLTPREELRLIGKRARRPTLPCRFVPNQCLPSSPVAEQQVESLQKQIDKCGSKTTKHNHEKPNLQESSFPLDIKSSSKLELDMINELKESWDAHVNSTPHHTTHVDANSKVLENIQSDSVQLRQLVEDFALEALNKVADQNHHWHESAHEMLRIAGLVPTANTVDLAQIAIDPSVIRSFNPMLTNESHQSLLESILTWLRLCVYEDKISRLISFLQSGATEDAIEELETVTVWDTSKHPYWLVFQVENAIMIRPEQYKVAQHLIDTPGDIIQLNMGLGKTRVILPMLVLYWSFKSDSSGKFVRDKVTRLHFLSALFEDAYKYLQNHLTASCFGIKIYTMPFCRDFTLDLASINTMKDAIDDCRVDGGVLVVAPEHRLSLELKAKELYRGGEKDISAHIENGIIKQEIWRDIFDEVDELLRHRYQLIYAIGTAVALPGGAHRWRAIQALFTALAQNKGLKSFLFLHPKACKLSVKSTAEWPEIQFFDGESLNSMLGDHLEPRSPQLLCGLLPKLADVILDNPPHELKWLQDHRLRDEIKKAMIDKEYTSTLEILPEQQLSDVLALRGFLAGGVLRHCLLKRHRVDYGVARPGKKRLAVPFRFADTPDLRSEFAHPDCAIAFTVLAYYHDGLTKEELMQALKSLMALGENAQSNFYNSWFVASSDVMKTEDPDSFESLDCIEKIDMTNSGQMEKMWHFYRKNMFTIAFYLNACVFPNETDQFDSRLTATSWNLAQNPSHDIVGFSGTNDNHRILPLQVRQFFASHIKESDAILKDLDGTNGKMIDMIIKCTLEVRQLGSEARCCQSIINILREGAKGSMQLMHAIIDCGALLAGSDLHEISKSILSILPLEKFGGVLFYDDEEAQDWVILERSGRLLPKDISPITEKEAFAIYDEPRCRGTDLKLRSEAVALLTLAPKLCKDKLMQAAGRLRRLGRNQKLIIAGGSDVFTRLSEHKKKMKNSSAIPTSILLWRRKQRFEATAVLSWAMKNTVESTAAGFPNWANQGLFFTSTFGKDPQLSITEEVLKLEDMYGKSFKEQTVVKLTKNAQAYHMKRTGGEEKIHSNVMGIVESINKRVEEYGGDFTFSAAGCDEECERELELEIEEEEEIEVEVPSVQPAKEKKWDFEKVLLCQSPKELPINTTLLPRFMEMFIKPTSLAKIKWSNKIYCTENFAKTIVCQADTAVLNSFLRVVNFILCFPNGNLLLVSEFEANGLLSLFWNSKSFHRGSSYQLLHSSLLRQSLDESTKVFLQRTLPTRGVVLNTLLGGRLESSDLISEDSMASLQLFAGECTYATNERKEALKSLLRVRNKMEGVKICLCTEAEHIVEMRGLGKLYPYSDLEALCEKLLCEI